MSYCCGCGSKALNSCEQVLVRLIEQEQTEPDFDLNRISKQYPGRASSQPVDTTPAPDSQDDEHKAIALDPLVPPPSFVPLQSAVDESADAASVPAPAVVPLIALTLIPHRATPEISVAAETIALSFAGTDYADAEPLMHWALGPDLQQLATKTRPNDERLALMRTCANFALRMLIEYPKNGFVLGTRLPANSSRNNNPIHDGVLACRYYPTGARKEFCEGFCGGACWGICVFKDIVPWMRQQPKYVQTTWKKYEKQFMARLEMLDKILSPWKKERFPKRPFIYVFMNGTLPDSQGHGVGSRQMRAVSVLADELDVPCWLECGGERNIVIYRRYGYEVEVRTGPDGIFCDKADAGSDWRVDEYVGMYRPSKSERIRGGSLR